MIREVGGGGLAASNRHRRDRCRTAAPHPRGRRPLGRRNTDHVALVEDGASWTYRELDRHVAEVAADLASLGIRTGDRMIIVSENCIALAAAVGGKQDRCLGGRRQSAAVAARDRPDSRSLRGAAGIFFTAEVSEVAAAHASRRHAARRSMRALAVDRRDGAECKRDAEPVSRMARNRWRPCSTPRARPAIRRA